MDVIEPRFRPEYEKICVGNKPAEAQDVFFEGLLLEEGLGTRATSNSLGLARRCCIYVANSYS